MTRLEEGKFARVPILLGNTDKEVFGKTTEAEEETRYTCPEFRSARAHTKYGPTYHYRWFGSFPSQAGARSLGPFHGSEISSVFGTYRDDVATPEQVETSKFMQKAWVEFAEDPVNGLRNLGWVSAPTCEG